MLDLSVIKCGLYAQFGCPRIMANIRGGIPLKLTQKQSRFIDEYLIDLNGAQAAVRNGYSPKCAKEQAY